MRQFGSQFHGSDSIQTSVANEEIIPNKVNIYKFSVSNSTDCTVSINGSNPIFLKGGMGFSTEQNDAMISSFKFLEDGIEYFWVGGS
ncbi:hypothetical protein CIL05_06870 [Virgibacillus profundi]|uniref:Uncharacterized protein n=1 Tax=Virgibacillus profundi TaxID=2024555 RepID=A0A2A2IG15_9BACI|nr:hypothetical protein [Virgibacillus profundi]PAV30184.1 hypothetical protein CIL05_06870 [Virgibacillus profundi]PXY54356.1 hypothetical protein CIT14_06955 [Virgibacillus profundi]